MVLAPIHVDVGEFMGQVILYAFDLWDGIVIVRSRCGLSTGWVCEVGWGIGRPFVTVCSGTEVSNI